eukprot:7384029-Pyramimonas_sp.AAC.1
MGQGVRCKTCASLDARRVCAATDAERAEVSGDCEWWSACSAPCIQLPVVQVQPWPPCTLPGWPGGAGQPRVQTQPTIANPHVAGRRGESRHRPRQGAL